jgi:hypothetical protein
MSLVISKIEIVNGPLVDRPEAVANVKIKATISHTHQTCYSEFALGPGAGAGESIVRDFPQGGRV